MNPAVHRTRLKISIADRSSLAIIAAVTLAGCVSPPQTTPAFPKASIPLPNSLRQGDDSFWFVDAATCSLTASNFTPEQLSYSRMGLSAGELEPTSLEALTTESDSTVPICILVHGYGYSSERSAEDARWAISRIRRAANGQPIRFVSFHWPSELEHSIPWPLLPRDMRLKGDRADIAGYYLAWLIEQFPPHRRVCIVGHSLGCRVAACALHLLGGGEPMLAGYSTGQNVGRPINAVFMAAAIDEDWLCPGKRYGASTHIAHEILVLTNRKDSSLRWYPLLNIRPGGSLGRGGLSPDDLSKLNAVGERVRVVSVEDEVGSNHNFRNYMDSETVANLVAGAIEDSLQKTSLSE